MADVEVRFSRELPPNWNELLNFFIVDWDKTVVTYGNTIHSQYPLPPDVKIHELVHVRQQLAYGVEHWWNEYILNLEFRLRQEVQAYREQYKFAKDKTTKPQIFLTQLAKDLSGAMYGEMIDFNKAVKLIRN